MSEELNEAPAALLDPEVNADDYEKLTALLDDNGELPDHSDKAVQEERGDAEIESPKESKEPKDEKQAESKSEGEQPKPAETQQAETAEVEMDGKKYTVPTDLKDAFLRFADYTRKTQEVAAERQTVQQERAMAQTFVQEAQQMIGQYSALQQIDAQLQQFAQLDWNTLNAQDPLRAVQLRQTASELVQVRNNAIAQLEHVRNARAQAQMQAFAQATSEGMKVVAREIPDWGADKQKALAEVALGLGFRPEELATVTDPRSVKMLNELHTLRTENAALKASQNAAQKQIRQAPPKPVRSSSVQQPGDETPLASKEISRLRRSGSDEDAFAALRALGIG